MPSLGVKLGRAYAEDLKNSVYSHCDIIIPVPLHNSRKKGRGYNQSELIAKGIGEILNIPVFTNLLVRNVNNPTQTDKHRFERWENVSDIFSIQSNEQIEGRHILLVDDVITTGSTLEACAKELLSVKGVRVSLAVLAMA